MNKDSTIYRRIDFFERDGTNKVAFWGYTLAAYSFPIFFFEDSLPFSLREKELLLYLTFGNFMTLAISRCEALAAIAGGTFGALFAHFIITPFFFDLTQHVEMSKKMVFIGFFSTTIIGYTFAMIARHRRNNSDKKIEPHEVSVLEGADQCCERPPLIIGLISQIVFFILLLIPPIITFHLISNDEFFSSSSIAIVSLFIYTIVLLVIVPNSQSNNKKTTDATIINRYNKKYGWNEWQQTSYSLLSYATLAAFVVAFIGNFDDNFLFILYICCFFHSKTERFGFIIAEMMRDIIEYARTSGVIR